MEAVFSGGQVVSGASSQTRSCERVSLAVPVLKAWRGHKEQLKLGTVGRQERPLEEVQPQEQSKGSWRKVEGSHHKESSREAIGVSGASSRRPHCFCRSQYCGRTTNNSDCGVEPAGARRQAMCAAEAGAGGVTQTRWRGPDDPEQIPHIEH